MLSVCMNLKNRAFTQFTNYNFNSFCAFNGKIYGASSNGICELETGSKDISSNIDAFFEFYLGDVGAINLKRIRALHFGGEVSGDMTVEVQDDDGTSKTYTITTTKTSNQQHGMRVFVERTHKGRYWKLKVNNSSGSDFSVDRVDVTWNMLAGTKQEGS